MNEEVIFNKLEHKVNDLTLRNKKLEKLEIIKDSLQATYRCEVGKELLIPSLNNVGILINGDIGSSNGKIAQLRINRDLALIRYYSMKNSIKNKKFEIEILRSLLR